MLRLSLTSAVLLVAVSTAQPQSPQKLVGEWRSEKSGHHGPMRAKLTPTADGYDMRVVGRFAAIIPFTYRTHLDVVGTTPEGPSKRGVRPTALMRTMGGISAGGSV